MSNGLRKSVAKFAMPVILIAVLALHSAIYLTATARIEAAIPGFISYATGQGWRVETGPLERTGWPWAPTIRLTHVIVSNTRTLTAPLWTGEQVDLTTPFDDLAALHIQPAGAQRVQASPYPPIDFHAAEIRLRIPFSASSPATFFIQKVVAGAPTTVIRVETIQGEAREPLGQASQLGITAHGIQLVPSLPPPFAGPMTASMQIVAKTAACSPAAEASAIIEITASETTWGPLHMTAAGTGGLDEQCQPIGRATLHVEGAVEIVDALAHGGLIAPGQASAARAVLSLLTIGARGQPITLPVALADRTLSIARIPLLRLPAIDWPMP